MIGRRVMPDENGYLKGDYVKESGTYGRASRDFVKEFGAAGERFMWWQVTAPDGSGVILNPAIHTVTEHEDGTITVHPSIVTPTWHGWLDRGVWRSV
jgi:hypothetical protein